MHGMQVAALLARGAEVNQAHAVSSVIHLNRQRLLAQSGMCAVHACMANIGGTGVGRHACIASIEGAPLWVDTRAPWHG